MTSEKMHCKKAMDCVDKECEKSHRLASYTVRCTFKQLNQLFVDIYRDELEFENEEGRHKDCSFGTVCNNPKCGYYHKDFAVSSRNNFRVYWEKFNRLSKEQQEKFLEEERAKIPSKEVEEEIEKQLEKLEKQVEKFDEEVKEDFEEEEEENSSSFNSLPYFERNLKTLNEAKHKFVAYLMVKYPNIENKDIQLLERMLGVPNMGD